jgi:hypothetical protein
MGKLTHALNSWQSNLCQNISLGGLVSRNKVAHKWKATLRSITLRECIFWRIQDLLAQAHSLYGANHILGSRILIRSAIETLAVLIHLNQLTEKVIFEKLDFHEFSEKTSQLLLGCRDGTTKHDSINIMTILGHCEKRYPGILGIYATLSESAHPNCEGICYGYSKVDHDNYETNFSNNWSEMWAERHEPLMLLTMSIFETEYNDVWSEQFGKLEAWIEANDERLEATRRARGADLEY